MYEAGHERAERLEEIWKKYNTKMVSKEKEKLDLYSFPSEGGVSTGEGEDSSENAATEEYIKYLAILKSGDFNLFGTYSPSSWGGGRIKALKEFKSAQKPRAGEDVIAEAIKTVGRGESGENRGVADMTGGIEGVPWCALYVSNYYGDQLTPEWSVKRTMDQVASKNAYFDRSEIDKIKAGDILFMAGGHHIGIVEKIENGKIYTIEGNYSDKVIRRERDQNSLAVTGFASFDKLQEWNVQNKENGQQYAAIASEDKELPIDYTKLVLGSSRI